MTAIKTTIAKLKATGGLGSVCPDIPDDLFLSCASYEERSLAVTEVLSPGYQARTGVVYVNREFIAATSGEAAERTMTILRSRLDTHCGTVQVAEGSWLDVKVQLLALRQALVTSAQLPTRPVITLDATTFNRESLITAVALLRIHAEKPTIRVVYASPKNHGDWLSRGFRLVRNVMGFAGIQQPDRPTVLVVLTGFESERTLRIIEEHEPRKVLLGFGSPDSGRGFFERNVSAQKLAISRQDTEPFTFPATGINKCRKVLESLVQPYLAGHNVVLAPMSTKPSTLAAMLVAERHPEIQITYCVPGEYNVDNYSSGVNSIYVDELPSE